MKILKLQNFPKCYGITMAQDFSNNELLGSYFRDAIETQNRLNHLPDNLIGLMALEVVQPIVEQAWKRFEIEFNKEMEKKRGEQYPCKDCPFRAGCLISAVLLIANKDHWL